MASFNVSILFETPPTQNNKSEGKTHSDCLQIQGVPVIRPNDLVFTNHDRKFKLIRLSTKPDATPIAIRHLWLNI